MLVLNFVPDAAAALQQMIRVTRPGGVVAAAVWDYGDGMQMLRTFWDAAVALDPDAAPRDERHMPLCTRGALAELWRTHGLRDVDEQPLTIDMAFASFDDYWQPFLCGQGPAGVYVSSLSESARHALESKLRAECGFDDAGARVGGARRRHLSALPKSRQSCGSSLMFGNMRVARQPAFECEPAAFQHRADPVLSTWQCAVTR